MKVVKHKLSLNDIFLLFSAGLILIAAPIAQAAAPDPQSTTYELKDYAFGAGGTAATGAASTSYSLFGLAGQVEYGKMTSANYGIGTGLTYMLKADVPPAATFTNPASNYDRLYLVVNQASISADYKYAVAISTDNFAADTRYIQSDFTPGSTFTTATFLDYAAWGSATGKWITGLKSGTTYYVKVKSRQGNFTESEWSTTASVATSDPILTFSIDSNTLTFAKLNAANSYTDNAKTTTLTTTTNAYNGYTIYGKESGALTSPNGTISDYGGTNAIPTTWSGLGFGYTTSDNNLGGTGGTTRFNSATKYAGFPSSTSNSGDPVADNSGPVTNPTISNETFTIKYNVVGNNLTAAGTYSNTITYTIVPIY